MTLRPASPAVLVVAAVALLALPAAAPAQSRVTVTPFIANNATLPGPSTLFGLAIGSTPGIFGFRASGAVGGLSTRERPTGGVEHRVGGYTVDLDGVFNAAAIPGLGMILGGFVPSVFAGLGVEGGRVTDSAAATSGPVLSYGVNVSRAILGNVGLESEARYRVPTSLDGGAPADGLSRGWEYRLGLSIGFGGRRNASGVGGLGLPRWPVATRPAPRSGAGAAGSASAARVVSTAGRYLGTPYRYGGATPDGFDCSGFVQYVYRAHGVTLPRTSRQQVAAGERVGPAVRDLRPGDLMLFDATGERTGIDHVAIYAGGNRMIHATASGGGVRYDDLSSTRGAWFVKRLVAARRVVADGRNLVNVLDASLRASQLLDPPDHAPRP